MDQRGLYCRRMVREKATEKAATAKDKAKALQADPPAELMGLVSWWNIQVDLGLLKGKVADRRGGEFVKSWLTLAGLIGGRNGDGELKLRKLLDGFYDQGERKASRVGASKPSADDKIAQRFQRLGIGGDGIR